MDALAGVARRGAAHADLPRAPAGLRGGARVARRARGGEARRARGGDSARARSRCLRARAARARPACARCAASASLLGVECDDARARARAPCARALAPRRDRCSPSGDDGRVLALTPPLSIERASCSSALDELVDACSRERGRTPRAELDAARARLDARAAWRADDGALRVRSRSSSSRSSSSTARPTARFCEAPRARRRRASRAGARSRRSRRARSRRLRAALASRPQRTLHVFRTSGTRRERARRAAPRHARALRGVAAADLPRATVLPDLAPGARARILVLAPSPREAPDSSLSHMFGARCRDARRRRESRFFVRGGRLARRRAARALARAARARAARCSAAPPSRSCTCSTRSRRAARALALPRRRARDGDRRLQGPLARAHARRALRRARGAPRRAAARIVNQYGMTRARQPVLRLGAARARARRGASSGRLGARAHRRPGDAARTRAAGEIGASRSSTSRTPAASLAVQTADLGRRVDDGFERARPRARRRGARLLDRARTSCSGRGVTPERGARDAGASCARPRARSLARALAARATRSTRSRACSTRWRDPALAVAARARGASFPRRRASRRRS